MALSAARVQTRQNNPDLAEVLMKASTTVYQGGGVMYDATGLAVPAADTAGCFSCGVAMETKTSPATGDTLVSVATSGTFRFKANGGAASAATWNGVRVYWVDDETVDLVAVATNAVVAGVCVRVIDANTVDVALTNAAS